MGTSSVVVRRDVRRRRKPAVRAPRNSVPSLAAQLPLSAFVTARRTHAADELGPFRSMLDAIEVPACIVGASGEILCANEIAMRYRPLNGTISRIPRDPGWDVVPLRIRPGCVGFLAICRWQTDESRIGDAVGSAVLRWRLTPRQGRVLALVAQGLTNADIADQLGIGEGTIEFHVSALFDKAGVENRATLIVRILEM